MSNIRNSIREMYALERLAAGGTTVHRLHPAAKLFSAMFFIVTVVSFDRYALLSLTPFAFYPAVLMALSGTPHLTLLKRFLAALPFCLFAGVSNIIFDRADAFALGGFTVSCGVLSFAALLFRAWLCVTAALILVATTRISEITAQLRRMRAPVIFVTMFELTYRYVGVLLDEAASMYTAHVLRGGGKGIEMRRMGSFIGQLLIRSFDRAERVYAAMKCRGYAALRAVSAPERRFAARDAAFILTTALFCVFFRVFPLSALINALLEM